MARRTRFLINDVDSCVNEMLEGVVNGNTGQILLDDHRVVVRNDIDAVIEEKKVTIVCGGGSGHEPFATGFVGKGMLSAAVAGSVFASPPPRDILAAIRAVQSPGGTLVIVANYTGDRLNFGIAVERAEAHRIKVAVVVVGEDCALQSKDKTAGRRGLVGIVNIIKIAGALAEQGMSLENVAEAASSAAGRMGTIGVSLSACSVPGSGSSFELPDTEMEVGLGAHGEAGVKRMKFLPADKTVEVLIDHLMDVNNPSHFDIKEGDKLSLIMNNLGGLSELEMRVVSRKAIEYIESKGPRVIRFYLGRFMTSFDMAGFNLNITKLDEMLISCLDFPTSAPAWPNIQRSGVERHNQTKIKLRQYPTGIQSGGAASKSSGTYQCEAVLEALTRCCKSVIINEAYLNDLDTGAGDGDCGTTLKRGATWIIEKLSFFKPGSAPEILQFVATCAEDSMGGASGGIYSLLLTSAARHLQDSGTLQSWCAALQAGIKSVSRYGGAEPGDRTMIDALVAIQHSLEDSIIKNTEMKEALKVAAKSAEEAAFATASMKARAGRASYVSRDQLTKPDAGAMGVGIWMKAIADI